MNRLKFPITSSSITLCALLASAQSTMANENLTWQELKLKAYNSQVSMPKPITLNTLTDSVLSLETHVTEKNKSLMFIADKLDRGAGGFFNLPIISLKREELLEDVTKKSMKVVFEQCKEMARKENTTANISELKFDKDLYCNNGTGKQYSFTFDGNKCILRAYIKLPDNHFQLLILGGDEKDPLAQKFFNSFQSLH